MNDLGHRVDIIEKDIPELENILGSRMQAGDVALAARSEAQDDIAAVISQGLLLVGFIGRVISNRLSGL